MQYGTDSGSFRLRDQNDWNFQEKPEKIHHLDYKSELRQTREQIFSSQRNQIRPRDRFTESNSMHKWIIDFRFIT